MKEFPSKSARKTGRFLSGVLQRMPDSLERNRSTTRHANRSRLKLALGIGMVVLLGVILQAPWGRQAVQAATAGPNSPTSSVNDTSVGSASWTGPANVYSSDDSRATVSMSGGTVSSYLKATGYGFSIPAGATINGIQVSVERSEAGIDSNTIRDSAVRIVKGGVIGATDKADTVTDWPAADTSVNYGGSADLWGEAWAAADINSADFGFAISATGIRNTGPPNSAETAQVDHISITITYTPPPASLDQSSYRWFANQDSAAPGAALAAQDTGSATPAAGTPFRLRMTLHAADNEMTLSQVNLKLQYAEKGAGTCALPGGSYADVQAATGNVRYHDNAAVADGSALQTTADDPSHAGHITKTQTYEEANDFSNSQQAVLVGEDALWDYALNTSANVPYSTTYCFRAVKSDGSTLTNYSVYPEITTESPPPIDQSSYRLYNNQDSLTPGAGLALQDTSATLTKPNQTFRLRMTLHVNTSSLNQSTGNFKLQFASKGAGTCASPTGTYADIGSSGAITFGDNASIADDSGITTAAGDPSHSGHTNVAQTYEEANSFVNSQAQIAAGSDGLWDFALKESEAPGNTTYCFRAVLSSGAALNSYVVYPEITTGPNPMLEQSGFRWFENQDGTTVGAPFANQDAPGSTIKGKIARLRMLLHISNDPLPQSGSDFKLQYAAKGGGTCSVPAGSYADITTTTTLAYADNPTPADGAALTSSLDDPVHGADTVVNQSYEEANPFTNAQAPVAIGQDAMWDFSLKDINAPSGTTYCVRAVQSDGVMLSTYTQFAEIAFYENEPTALIQFDENHLGALAVGSQTISGVSTNIFLDFMASSSTLTESFTPKTEVRATDTAFAGTQTHAGDPIEYDSELPSRRRSTDMVYDSNNQQLVLIGGYQDTGVNLDDVWLLSLKKNQRSQWKKITPGGTGPGVKRAHQLVYDSGNNRVLLFGGYAGSASSDSVFSLSMTPGSEAWTTLTVSGTAPSHRIQHSAIYDSTGNRMFVYGGRDDGSSSLSNTLYQLTLPTDGSTPAWSTPSVTGAPASGRELATMTYDSANNYLWLHGGCAGGTNCTRTADIWKLDLATLAWTQTSPTGSCPHTTDGINGHAMGYDAVNQQAVVFGGKSAAYTSAVYTFTLPASGNPACVDHSPPAGAQPHARGIGSTKGVYDTQNKQMIFGYGYDGSTYTLETYTFDKLDYSGTWGYKQVSPITYLRERDQMALIMDPTNNYAYGFGGAGRVAPASNPPHLAETWRLRTTKGSEQWENAGPSSAPFQREGGDFIRDSANSRGIYCMGININTMTNDCWTLSLPGNGGRAEWSFLEPTGTAPAARWGVSGIYDSTGSKMVVFGGEQGTMTRYNDVHFLSLPTDGSTPQWSQPAVSGTAPAARRFAANVYDSAANQMIIFGGSNGEGGTYYNDVWALSLTGTPTWSQLSPSGTAPSARDRHFAVYDPNNGSPRMLVFGGYDKTNHYNDVWALSLSGTPAWTQLSPTGTAPSARRSATGVFDEANDRMIIYAGRDASSFFADTYELDTSGATPAWRDIAPKRTVPLSVPVSGLLAGTSYHWQAWATGSTSGDTIKRSYGGNTDTLTAATDFSISPNAAFSQSAYRFYNNADSNDVGSPLANQDSSGSLSTTDAAFRLRLNLHVSGRQLDQSGANFKLQYALKGSGTCSAPQGAYGDVVPFTSGSTEALVYNNNATPADGSPLTANANDPSHSGHVTRTQTYEEANNFTNSQSAIAVGEDGMWDFSLKDNVAPDASTYCFRVVKSDGNAIDTYNVYPEVQTYTAAATVSTDIVDSTGTSVVSPVFTLANSILSFNCQDTTGTFGDNDQRIRIASDTSQSWTVTMAAAGGATAKWTTGSSTYDFNDPAGSSPGCSDGPDTDTDTGQLTVNPSGGAIAAKTGCTNTGLSLGSSSAFNEGTVDDITLLNATGSDTNCYWDLTGVGLSQRVGPETPTGAYKVEMVITVIAN